LTQLTPTYSGLMFTASARYRAHLNYLLYQAIEKLAPPFRGSSIESESKLIQIIIQMGCLDSALVCPQQPPFKQRGNSICPRQKIFSNIRFLPNNTTNVTQLIERIIPTPTIRTDFGAWINSLFDGLVKAFRRSVGHSFKTYPANPSAGFFNRNEHQFLTFSATPTLSRPRPTNVSFINFHDTRKTITVRPNHGSAELVKPIPYDTVATETKNPLKSERADTVFLIGDIPHGSKPKPQRLFGVLQDRARQNGSLKPTFFAKIKRAAHRPQLFAMAFRALNTVRPSCLSQIISAGFLSLKSFFKFHKRPGVIFHGIVQYNMWGLVESSV